MGGTMGLPNVSFLWIGSSWNRATRRGKCHVKGEWEGREKDRRIKLVWSA